MNSQEVLDPKSWAERTFGSVQLHDLRRTRRAVQAATNLAETPWGVSASSNAPLEREQSVVSFARRARCQLCGVDAASPSTDQGPSHVLPVVLLLQDTTDIDLSYRHKISGVGQIGNERGRVFFMQAVLELPARQGHQKRSAQLQLSFGRMTLLPPRQEPRASQEPLHDARTRLERVNWYGHH